MEWRKLKNLIILILLMVNGFLLVLVVSRREESARYERAALERTIQVLERGGIRVEPAAADSGAALAPVPVERDLEREAQLVRTLLDEEVQGENRGGGLYLYRGALGEVSLRSGGELSVGLADDGHWNADRPEQHAAALLKELGIEGVQIGVDTGDEETAVRFRQSWKGAPLFSCEVELTYRGGRLRSISGALLMGAPGTAETGPVLTLPTALMRFSEEIAATGDVCSSLQSMEAGYRGTVQSLSGGVRLVPVWLVSTNTAQYYLDCATGALTRIMDQ